jgi:predicted O-methyltransferase YrrM
MRGANGASGSFSTSGLLDMIHSIGNTKEMTMIEIGSYIGESTIMFAENFKKVLAIDPHQTYDEIDENKYAPSHLVYDEFIKNTKTFNNIEHIRKTSDDAFLDIKEMFDFVYIDGLHTYEQVKKDILNYKPLIKETGIIGGHDYIHNWVGVVNAVDEILGRPDFIFNDSSWYKKI